MKYNPMHELLQDCYRLPKLLLNCGKDCRRRDVGISGTGGGLKKFRRGETDISDASRLILKPELEAASRLFIQCPNYQRMSSASGFVMFFFISR
jgi:hypothetical protein